MLLARRYATQVPLASTARQWASRKTPSAPGQHLLEDAAVIARIVEAAALQPGDTVLEVGPGDGRLTRALLSAVSPGGTVRAVELGPDMVRRLEWSLLDGPDRPGPSRHHGAFGESGAGRAAINFSHGYVRREEVHGDVTLELICGSAQDESLPLGLASVDAVVGNLPYSISSPFLKRLALLDGPREVANLLDTGATESATPSTTAKNDKCDSPADFKLPRAKWRSAVFLVQDEFAHKAAANPSGATPRALAAEPRHKQSATHGGGGSYGHLAVLLRAVSVVDLVGALVLPAAFNPPPAVNSRVLRLVRREDDMDVQSPPSRDSIEDGAVFPSATDQHCELRSLNRSPDSNVETTVSVSADDNSSCSNSGNAAILATTIAQQWLAFVRLCWAAKRRTVRANLTAKGVLRRLDINTTSEGTQPQKEALMAVLDSPRFIALCAKRAVEVEPEVYRQLFIELHSAGVVFPDTSAPRDAPEMAHRRVHKK